MKADFGRPQAAISWVIALALIGGIFSLLLILGYVGFLWGKYTAPGFTSSGPTQKQLEAMGHLTVLKLSLADILEGRKYGCRGTWLIKGDAVYGVDMRKAAVRTRDDESRKAVLVLPAPAISRPRVDHEKTKTYSTSKETWVPWGGDEGKLRDESMLEAQELVERAATSDANIQVAKRNAELVLRNVYDLVGWDVAIEWETPKLK